MRSPVDGVGRPQQRDRRCRPRERRELMADVRRDGRVRVPIDRRRPNVPAADVSRDASSSRRSRVLVFLGVIPA